MSKFYLTTPIYYVNDVPHIGHAYTTIAADVLARYHRGRGDDVYFLTGTDEHGAKVAEAAAARGKEPQEFVDEIVGHFKEAWQKLDIGYDYFIRTSDKRHEDGVRKFFEHWHGSDDIYKGVYEGLYCVSCERFYAEDELINGLCPDHQKPPIQYSEENYFFRLSRYTEPLIKAITDETDPNHFDVEPAARRNEVLGKLRLGLQDISISRGSLTWGVPLPFDPSHTAYVWIDALLNYATAVGYGDDSEQFARYWPAELHLLAKDILWFHAIIWPAMLISNGVRPPKRVYAHGFFTVNGRKMSKTVGNVIAPAQLVERYGADGARYLLLSEFPFGTDGNVSLDSMDQRFNSDLANDLGNLLNRTVSMINRYFDGSVPAAGAASGPDADLRGAVSELPARVGRALDNLEFSVALEAIRQCVTAANRYVDQTQPWTLAKNDRERLATVLRTLVEAERLIAIELAPFIPSSAGRMLEQLGLGTAAPGERVWGAYPADGRVGKPNPLFPKLEAA
jgi:methionyl-tRNA synthetase